MTKIRFTITLSKKTERGMEQNGMDTEELKEELVDLVRERLTEIAEDGEDD